MSSLSHLRADGLVKAYGERRVLDGVSLVASPGQRIGLVGENGVGKSTLLRLLAGVEPPDAGAVRRPADTALLHQELPFRPEHTVQAVLDDALRDVRDVLHRLDHLAEHLAERPADEQAMVGYGELLEWAQAHDAWDAQRRARLVLDGVGLAAIAEHAAARTLDTMSGGERSRLGLAALLIRRPGALLLDEPTNHLDDEAVAFVERYLRTLPGVVVAASHDRVFLDSVCTDIVDLDPTRGGPVRYGGAYSDYLHAKRAERARWEQQYSVEQEELAQLRRSVAVTARQVNHDRPMTDRNKMAYGRHGERVQHQISRRVRNAQQRLDELTARQVRKPPVPLRFRGAVTAAGSDGLALAVRDVVVPGRLALDELDVPSDARLLVTGPNGAGKSTLLELLAGRLPADRGAVHRRRGVRVGLLDQDVMFDEPRRTPRSLYRGAVPLTELGLIAPRDVDRPVGELSVGQRRRLALAMLIADTPHVLLLDEPTNHISLALAEELEEAMGAAPGALVVATHDRWLRRRWTGPELTLRSSAAA